MRALRIVLYWLCFALMAGLIAYMNLVTLAAIRVEAGGLVPFDLQSWGYDEATARAFLTALSPEGRDLYLGLQHRLDAIFPPVMALVLVWTFFALLPRRWALVAAVPAVLGLAADLIENARVAGLLTAGTPEAAQIAAASAASLAKSALISLALLVLVVTLLRAVVLWWRGVPLRGVAG